MARDDISEYSIPFPTPKSPRGTYPILVLRRKNVNPHYVASLLRIFDVINPPILNSSDRYTIKPGTHLELIITQIPEI